MKNKMTKRGDAEKEKELISFLSIQDDDFGRHLEKVEGELSVDVFQTDTSLVILAPVAGVEVRNIDISINDNEILCIKGSRELLIEAEEEDYLTRECFWGAFSRSILLPEGLDTDSIRATFKKGILRIEIPKVKYQKTKTVKISD